jgi:hypothetical protein
MTETEHDKMVVIKVLYQSMNWSFRRIGRLFSQHKNTVSALYYKALDELCTDNIANLPKSRKGIDLRYVGSTSDVEYIEGSVNHNVCGGGRKVSNEPKET